jgi:hypothetical protein
MARRRLFRQPAQQLRALGVVTQEARGRGRKGPREGRMADFLPAVPTRLPPESWRHLTRRPSEATACPRGQRSIGCLS